MKRAIVLAMILALVAGFAPADVVKQTNERYVVIQGEAPDEILNPDAKTNRVGTKVLDKPEEPAVVFTVTDDPKASGGKALVSPAGGSNKPEPPLESVAVYRAQMTTAGTYYVYFRARNNGKPKDVGSDSFFVAPELGNVEPSVNVYVQNSGEYKWQKLSKSFLLLPGDIEKPIELRIGVRESMTHIDAFVFSRDNGLDKTPEKLDALVGLK